MIATMVTAMMMATTPTITKVADGSQGLTCPERFTSAYGHVQSENGVYANGAQECWLISPEHGAAELTLSFREFDVEEYYDALFVYDGDHQTENSPACAAVASAEEGSHETSPYPCLLSPPTGFSGSQLPRSVTAKSGAMLLIFVADMQNPRKGFTFAWTSTTSTAALPAGACAPECQRSQLGNGACDQACYNEACSWDKRDCDAQCDMASGEGLHRTTPRPLICSCSFSFERPAPTPEASLPRV